mgnify:CR=1 FL=1
MMKMKGLAFAKITTDRPGHSARVETALLTDCRAPEKVDNSIQDERTSSVHLPN